MNRPDPTAGPLPVGAVFYERRRWWRQVGPAVQYLITPRGHAEICYPGNYGDKADRTARARRCGCYICRDLLATPGWAA